MAIDKELIEMMLSELPVAKRYINDASKEIGMVRAMINVALHLPKNAYTTNTTRIKVIAIVSFKEFIVRIMLSEVSTITPSFTSDGSDS